MRGSQGYGERYLTKNQPAFRIGGGEEAANDHLEEKRKRGTVTLRCPTYTWVSSRGMFTLEAEEKETCRFASSHTSETAFNLSLVYRVLCSP